MCVKYAAKKICVKLVEALNWYYDIDDRFANDSAINVFLRVYQSVKSQ